MERIQKKFLRLCSFIALLVCIGTGVLIFSHNTVQKRISRLDIIKSNPIIHDQNITKSPVKNEYAFITYSDLTLRESNVWLQDVFSNKKTLVASNKNYSYYINPIWSPDGSYLAFLQVYPFKLWVWDTRYGMCDAGCEKKNDMAGANYNLQLLYSVDPKDGFVDDEKKGLLNPKMDNLGALNFEWLNNETIIFENTNEVPETTYSINVKSGEINNYYVQPVGAQMFASLTYMALEWPVGATSTSRLPMSQRDPQWANDQLGGCETDTIGSAGCAVTAISMMLTSMGYNITPDNLNETLTKDWEKGYFDGCYVRWNMIPFLYEDVILKGVYFNDHNINRLKNEIDLGNYVLLGWNNVAFTDIAHWTLVTRYDETGIYVADPWTGEEKELEYFGSEFDHIIVYEKEKVDVLRNLAKVVELKIM